MTKGKAFHLFLCAFQMCNAMFKHFCCNKILPCSYCFNFYPISSSEHTSDVNPKKNGLGTCRHPTSTYKRHLDTSLWTNGQRHLALFQMVEPDSDIVRHISLLGSTTSKYISDAISVTAIAGFPI